MKRMHWAAAAMAIIVIASGTVFAATPDPAPSDEDWEMTASEFDALMETGDWVVITLWTDDDVSHVLVIASTRGGTTTRSITVSPDG